MTFPNIWKPPTPVYPVLVTMSLSSQAVMSKPSPTVISNASIFPDSWKCSSCIQNSKINLRKTSNTIWLTILEKVTMLRYMSLTKLAASYWVCSHSSFRSVPIFPIITISSDTLEYIYYYFLYPSSLPIHLCCLHICHVLGRSFIALIVAVRIYGHELLKW